LALQEATPQVLLEHEAVPLAALQTVPQAPQLLTLLVRLVSQPLAAIPSQLPHPALQEAMPHVPPEQDAVPLGAVQTWPQEPQLLTSVFRFLSQPLATLPSQLSQPALQEAMPQVEPEQDEVALAAKQALPQAPQLVTLVVVSISQPLAALPSQLAQPALQDPIPHTAPEQAGVALAAVQTMPHAPQLPASVSRLDSQPSITFKLQSFQLALQLMPQADAAHLGAELGRLEHALPQAPQFEASMSVSISQPLALLPSQLAQPTLQASPQIPVLQTAVALAPPAQVRAHWPQFATSAVSEVSQPSALMPLQFPKRPTQVRLQVLPPQLETAWAPVEQEVPQAPQLPGSKVVLVQVPVQSVRPAWQLSRHRPAEQT